VEPKTGVVAAGEIRLSAQQLTAWDGWSAQATEFIATQGEAVALRPVVELHGKLVAELNLWLYEELAAANASLLAQTNLLIDERNAILGGTGIEEPRRVTRALTRRRESPRPDSAVAFGTLMPKQGSVSSA
jgi:hypothetical protein